MVVTLPDSRLEKSYILEIYKPKVKQGVVSKKQQRILKIFIRNAPYGRRKQYSEYTDFHNFSILRELQNLVQRSRSTIANQIVRV